MNIKYCVPVLLLITLSGCGLSAVQKDNVTQFAKATSGIGAFAATELSAMRAANIEMNAINDAINSNVELRGEIETDIDDARKEPTIEADKFRILYGPFSTSAVSDRISAAKALSTYGQLLLALVNEDQTDELKAASDQFVASFGSLPDQPLKPDQLQSLGILIQEVGGLIVEYKREEAVKGVVAETEKTVADLCTLLSEEFQYTLGGEKLADAFKATILKLSRSAANNGSMDQGGTPLTDRKIVMDAFRLASQQDDKLQFVYAETSDTLSKTRAANEALAKSLINNGERSIGKIVDMARQFTILGNAVKTISDD